MSCIEKLPHSCGSSNGLQVFTDEKGNYNGYCFACSTFVPDPYQDKPKDYKPTVIKKTYEQIQAEIAEISTYKTIDLPDRKLRADSLAYFGVKIGVSEVDGVTPVTHYYPYYKDGELVAYKVRLIETKRMWAIGSTKDVNLFGWQQALSSGAKRLYITEGELDAVSLYQIFKDSNRDPQYAQFNPAIVSLSNGAGSAPRDLAKALKEIRQTFKEIVLVFDMDEPGKKAMEEVVKIIPDALCATLPAKDVNDCLVQGRSKACHSAVLFNAQRPKNTRLVHASEVVESARKEAEWGFSYPYKALTDLTRGQRFGETVYWGAGVKMG